MSRHGFLGVTYHVFRIAQFVTLISIIGLTANFIKEMNDANITPPTILVAILSIVSSENFYQICYNNLIPDVFILLQVSLAALYLIIVSILFFDEKIQYQYPLIIDAFILAGLIIIAVIAGKPLSYMQCKDIGTSSSASTFASTLAGLLSEAGDSKFSTFIATTQQICTEMKAVWGLVIANW